MKTLLIFLSLLLPLSAFGHGAIEDIQCENKAKKVTLKGVPIDKDNNFKFTVTQAGKNVSTTEKVKLALNDVVVKNKVVEKITFKLSGGNAELMVPEDYDKEVRPGTGKIKLSKLNTDVDCKVTY